MIVVGTVESDIERAHRLLERLGAEVLETVVVTADGRVVRARVDDPWAAEPIAAALRADGESAVVRPDGGAALEAWRAATAPRTFGGRVSVSLAVSEHARGHLPGLVELGPGGFGSGHHPTTAMLLDWLSRTVSGGERILDVGCGTGVLALAGLQCGAAAAIAVDLKGEAIAATLANAERNGFAGRLTAGDDASVIGGGAFDIVMANIARAGIVALAGQLVDAVARGGLVAVSGITPQQVELVAAALEPLVSSEVVEVDGWALLVLERR